MLIFSNILHCISVFDKLIWHTIGPKNFVFGTAQFSLGAVAQLFMIILSLTPLTHSELAQDVFSMAHIPTIF